jgi:hypothetical protein
VNEVVTPALVENEIMRVIARLDELVDEQAAAAERLSAAKAAYERAYLVSHLASVTEHPKRKVGEHETVARHAALEEYEELTFAEEHERALRHEAHTRRQELSALQSLNGNVRQAAGLSGYTGRPR